MSKPTTKAMVSRLEILRKQCELVNEKLVVDSQRCPECPCGQCEHELDAIRRLILAVEEWKKKIIKSEVGEIKGFSSDALRILEEIRDFGKEADDE